MWSSSFVKTPRTESPFKLMQEAYRDDPWALLCGCVMFNMVQGSRARPVLERFLGRWLNWCDFINGMARRQEAKEAFEMLKPLGLGKRRLERLLKMSLDFERERPDKERVYPESTQLERIKRIHGIGKYGQDSFRIFCLGELVEDVEDKELKRYVAWARGLQSRE